ncbi:NAD(P)/FAD-dependent oxidoreductase [Nitriliruptor alkaliphilus]|uniref:NAD(P)/FAD-dependent oxidoreductase n=1 Tax=Nitriliruptor alkaliphilus TaxID=427918 RepID=UPI000AD4B8FB|nr:FAD-dependent oxidoreductase [Nitriliruptor alkaliphilus]
MTSRPSVSGHVVVLGAGYAGAHAARGAREGGVQVTVVDPSGDHGFLPRLAGVAAGRSSLGDARAALEDLVDVDVARHVAERVDVARHEVILAGGGRLSYDALVVTVGAATHWPDVPGLRRHATSLRDAEDALRLRATLPRTGSLVIVGGGSTGVQLAAELGRARPHLAITLVEEADRLLPAEPASLASAAGRLLRDRDVEVLRGHRVRRVDAGGVDLDGPARRRDGTVLWVGGWQAQGDALLREATTRDGRLVVGRHLEVLGAPGVFAAGDVAAHRDLFGQPLSMSAQIALQAGRVAGANAAALVTGRRRRTARLLELGRVLDVGGGRGVGRIGPVPLGHLGTDRVVPLLHLSVDLRHLWKLGGARAVIEHAPGRDVGVTATVGATGTRLRAVG